MRRVQVFGMAATAASLASTLVAQVPKSEMFPFVIPWDDAAKTATDVSGLNPAPIDETRRISVKGPHFVDGTGRRVKFFGVNLTFGANFPDKETAARMAARMRKFGINCVRLHHLDMFKAPNGIFDPKREDLQHLDAGQLDRLDYLVSQLKQNGIYIDLNLHVSRAFTAADGFPDTDKLPSLGKVTAYFEPRMIELQKNYARDLLTHLNPYTKLRYADDPAIALVELNNEDSLLGEAFNGILPKLPPHYRGELGRQWNAFLAAKYPSTGALKLAWNRGSRPLGANMLRNPQFSSGVLSWNLEAHEGTQARMISEKASAPGAWFRQALRVNVVKTGAENWHVQLHQRAIDMKPGETYTVGFWARSERPRKLPVYAGLDIEPWSRVGLDRTVDVSPQWKEYTFTFTAGDVRPAHNRLVFVLGDTPGNVWIADVSLRPGAENKLSTGETLETRTIGMPEPGANPRGEDLVAFLIEVERKYADGLRSYIKNELKSKALVTCSQAQWGGVGGLYRESKMDWVDTHAYWQHPSFPPGKSWNPREWSIKNVPMVSDPAGGTFPGLAMYRLADKPFTVTEYNHPAPNDFSAEALPLLAFYALKQDWDGIFLFDYSDSRDARGSDRIRNFFSIDTHPAKMALMPAAATVFLGENSLLPPVSYIMTIPAARITKLAARYGWDMRAIWASTGARDLDYLNDRIAVRIVPGDGTVQVDASAAATLPPGTWEWSRASPDSSLLRAAVPGSHAIVGFGRPSAISTDDSGEPSFSIKPASRGFMAVALTARDGKPTPASRSLLLTAVGRVENQGMAWNPDRSSVGDQWGKGPTVAEGIAAAVTVKSLAGMARVHALDGSGTRKALVPSNLQNGSVTFNIGPEHKTLWYEIELLAAPGSPRRGNIGGLGAAPSPLPPRGGVRTEPAKPAPDPTAKGPIRGIPR